MNAMKNKVIHMMNSVEVGETIEFLGRTITRSMPGLWLINGVEHVGVCEVLDAFNCR